MMHHIRKGLAAAILAVTVSTGAQAAPLTTGDFTGWLPRVATFGNTGSTITFPTTGGNSDAHVQITNFSELFVNNAVYAGILSPDAVVATSGTWASTLSIDFYTNSNPGGDHHAIGLIAEQGGNLFYRYFDVTGVSTGWDTYTSAAFSFTGSDFDQLDGTGAVLDFSQPFLAGFATANSRSGTRGSAYDNLSLGGVELAAAPVPLPATAILLIGALGGLGVARARRRV